MSDLAKMDVVDQVAWITITRPQVLNALSMPTTHVLREFIEAADADPRVRVIVLTATGRAFCTGYDLSTLETGKELSLGADLENSLHPVFRAMREASKPVVSAVNGIVAGIGVAMALSADIVIARNDAYFLQPFLNIAVIPDGGSTYLLPRLVGMARAKGMAMLAERITADQAADFGLIWKSVPGDEFLPTVSETARRLASFSPTAMAATKRALEASIGNDYETQLAYERDTQDRLGQREEFKLAIDRFLGH